MKISAYAASVVAALCLAVTGCSSDDEPGGSSPTATPSSTTTSDAPPAPPELPAAATKKTAAGAEAFVKYYWAVVDYSQANGTVALLKTLSTPECSNCRLGWEGIEELVSEGGSLRVGAIRLETSAEPLKTTGDLTHTTVSTHVHHARGREFYGANDPRNVRIKAGVWRFAILCSWSEAGAWQIHTLAPVR